MMLIKLLFTACLALTLGATPAWANRERVVAVVNDQVITQHDLDQRLQLTIRTLNTTISANQRQRLLQQSLQQLVNEAIVKQFAASRDLKVDERLRQSKIRQLEQQYQLSPGSFTTRLGALAP